MRGENLWIKHLITEFFDSEKMQTALQFIFDNEITGWEKWFQVEFAQFIAQRTEITSWQREVHFWLDGRKVRDNNGALIDFVLQTPEQAFWAVELKQSMSYRQCLQEMLLDLKKLQATLGYPETLSELVCVGIHTLADPEAIHSAVQDYVQGPGASKSLAAASTGVHVWSEKIGGTGFQMTVIHCPHQAKALAA